MSDANAGGYEQIRYEVTGDVAIITLNRPDRLNAWTRRMSAEYTDAVGTATESLGFAPERNPGQRRAQD